jgi:hypothetical protein
VAKGTRGSHGVGTDKVAAIRREYQAQKAMPALYGCNGLVDIHTIDQVLRANP